MEMWINLIIAILGAITAAAPLAVALYKTAKTAKTTKDWAPIMSMVIDLMQQAEQNIATGIDRKEWVLSSLRSTAESLGVVMDEKAVSDMIDAIAAASKIINTKK